MLYKYTYKDWEEGKIIWNSIASNKYEVDYISSDCIDKIKQRQQLVLENESKRFIEIFIKQYNLNRRADTNRNTTVNKFLQTIDNLFNSDLNTFKDVIILDEKQAMTNSIPVEFKNKEIPPLNFTHLNANDIKAIQSIFLKFSTSGLWNYEVIETPVRNKLWKYVDFRNLLFAKTYYNFSNQLRNYKGIINNTFNSELEIMYLKWVKEDLIKYHLIDSQTKTNTFLKVFRGFYLLKNERINWLGNLDSLRYFIVSLDSKIHYSVEYGKWQTVANCFVILNSEINPDTLRKAVKINNYPTEKERIIKALSSLK